MNFRVEYQDKSIERTSAKKLLDDPICILYEATIYIDWIKEFMAEIRSQLWPKYSMIIPNLTGPERRSHVSFRKNIDTYKAAPICSFYIHGTRYNVALALDGTYKDKYVMFK